MRIASNMLYNQLARGLKDNLNDFLDINNQLATGKKINKPSDDVLGTLKAMDYKLSISQNTQSEQLITEATNYLNFNNMVLGQISDTLQSLKKLTSQTGKTSVDQSYYASQAVALRDTLQDLSNSTYLNRYIFSGSHSDQKAYVFDSTKNQYVYQGDAQQMSVSLGTGMTATALNVVGNSLTAAVITPFSYTLQAATTVTLSSGSQATSTPVADPAHNSTIIQVQITDPNHPGDPNYQDNFSFSNVMDMANLLSHAWQNKDVDGTTGLSAQKAANRIEVLAGSLDKAQNQLLTVQGQIGIRQAQINDQKSRVDTNTVTQKSNLSQIEDANMDETIIELQKVTTTLNALRSASAKMLSQSLFDFLR